MAPRVIKKKIITIVFFVIEIKINGNAVGMVSIGGKNYGALIATIIALINVYGSALVGYVVLKNMNHLDKNKQNVNLKKDYKSKFELD